MHQKCSNYALTNLLFGLCKSMWIIDPIFLHLNPHLCRNLGLGLATKAKRGCKVAGQEEPESHITYSREFKKVREWTLTLPRQLPLWEMDYRWSLETSESDFNSQNLMDCDIFYIIGKLLERKCLKWLALLIWTFETQVMAKRRAESQTANLTSDHKKLGIDPIYLAADNLWHTIGKLLTRATTFL